jgi:hypothetical protein
MARKSRMSMLKRQRELKKAEKAAQKRAKRHGIPEPTFTEPRPTVVGVDLDGNPREEDEDETEDREESVTADDAQA